MATERTYRRGKPVTHYKLNRIIVGVGALYAIIIVAAVFFGPDTSSNEVVDTTPDFEETVSEDDSDYTGVGGVPAERASISGTVVDTASGEPLEGVAVIAEDDGTLQTRTRTDADGSFELEEVSETATISFSLDGYHSVQEPADQDSDYTVEMATTRIAGRVVNEDGSPIQGATVAVNGDFTRTVENGAFQLDDVPEDAVFVVKAGGYEPVVVSREEFQHGFTLSRTSIQGIYASGSLIADEARFTELLDLIERTDLNALVFDIKDMQGHILYDSDVTMAQEIDAVNPAYDVHSVLSELEERGIYAIGRMVVFADTSLAEARPDLAINDALNDEPWRTWQGQAWANPYNADVWEYNAAIMQEAVSLGFDEVQLSHVRFPDEGPLNRADYGQANTRNAREQAIAEFLDHAYAGLATTEAMMSVDVFALTMWDQAGTLIGQDLQKITSRVDYVSPLLFPSHFQSGSLGYESPTDHPYDMVSRSIESGMSLLPRYHHSRIRPWLQDFSYGSAMPFDAESVRLEIEAARDYGASGWMLWNTEGEYSEEALTPTE
jgi:hypothetical protein